MRLAKLDRYFLILAALFALAVLRGRSLPGEDVLPDLFGAMVEGPVLANAAGGKAAQRQKVSALESENASLRREVEQLRGDVENARSLRRYFDKLKWRQRPRAVAAWVVGIDPDHYRRSFRIRTSSGERLRLDPVNGPHRLAVVTGRALLGVVDFIDNRRLSTVRRIDDDRFRIEAEVTTPAGVVRGIVEGRGEEQLSLGFVRHVKQLSLGMEVFTSAYDPDIPPGLLIGRIESIEDPENDGVEEVRVVPAAAFVRLGQVEVLVPKQGS